MKLKIHKKIGECITVNEFCNKVSAMIGQTPDMIEYALSFMLEELGQVEAMELYCDTCGITAY